MQRDWCGLLQRSEGNRGQVSVILEGDAKPNWIQLLAQKGATGAVFVPGLRNNKRCKVFGTHKRTTGRNTWTQAEIRL